jgi:hypothetical protein
MEVINVGKVVKFPAPFTYCKLVPLNPMFIVPLVVIGEPVIFKLSPLSVIPTLVTVPVEPEALCHIEPE